MHESFNGETAKLTAQKLTNFGLVNFQQNSGFDVGQPPRANAFANANRKIRLRETLFGALQTDVVKNISAAFLDGNPTTDGPSFPSGYDSIHGCQSLWEYSAQSEGRSATQSVALRPIGMLLSESTFPSFRLIVAPTDAAILCSN